MPIRNHVFRGGLTLCVALLVAVAGSAGAAPKAAPARQFAAAMPAEPSRDAAKPSLPFARPSGLRQMQLASLSPELPAEVEPNDTAATATPLSLDANNYVRIQGTVFPAGADVDYYVFTAQPGDRVYAATMTAGSAGSGTATMLALIASDGTTVIESDTDDGSFSGTSSSLAGTTIPSAGTYYLRVMVPPLVTDSVRPYELHVRLQRGAPTPEVESNDTPATANPLPASGWVSGARNPAAATEQDWYSFTANAGDTVFLSLDADPERDGVAWNGRLGIALFGDATNQILVVDDSNNGSAAVDPPSEAMFFTIKTAGTYYAFVDSASAAAGGPTATYHLSVSVAPLRTPAPVSSCVTYTSTDVPRAIGPGIAKTSSTIAIPGHPRIADLDVSIVLNHAVMNQIDAHLRSPANNDVGLFTDIGSSAVGGQSQMDATFDDEAAIPPAFTVLRNVQLKPESNYRLNWFDGEDAGGTWTLDLYDDTADANGGTLSSWSLRVCEAPPPPTCAAGFAPVTVYATDFESGSAGFTHSGTQDEWELGLPATVGTTGGTPSAAFDSCASGTNCWRTDLDNTYNASSNQDLTSPAIDLSGLSPPVVVSWSQRYQLESANFDHYNVDLRQVGGAAPVRLFEWLDATMTDAPGPGTALPASAGWGRVVARADALAGQHAELNFHLDSDSSVQLGGVAIDDVSVTACRAASADLSITKTDGVTTAIPGGSATYTITASNAGPSGVSDAVVADTFPASLTCTWTCVGAGGGTCTASGAGNIADTANLPAGGSATYTASCAINAAASGSLANTATVSSSSTDPNPANNSATDTDTLTAQADLSITKTDGVVVATPGGSATYTITASNAGPSNATGTTVADTFPASLTCTWTCVGAGGGTCTASGAGNIADTANLPAGGSAIYTASCAISAAASGSLANTATVASSAADPDPANNSATDTDTLTPQTDLSITKTDGVTSVLAGGTTTYTITSSNAGPSDAVGATVTDTFPAALTCTWTCVGAGGGTCTASGSGNISDSVNLPAGGSVTHTASCSIGAAASGSLANTATVAAPAGATDPTPGNNSATDTDSVLVPAVVRGTKTVAGAMTSGGTVTYTIVLSDVGGAQGDNPGDEFVDTLPPSLTLVSANATSGTAIATVGTNTVSWNGAIAAGGSVTITITATINAGFTGTVSNQGVINFDSNGDGSNDATTQTDDPGTPAPLDATVFQVVPTADLSITKTDGVSSVVAGGSTTYTIVAHNAGPNALSGVSVTDTFPPGLVCTWTCAGSGGGTCTASGSGNIGDSANLPLGASATYTAGCSVSATASGTLSNTATVAAPVGANDPDPSNNSAVDVDTVRARTAVTATKTVSGTFQPNGSVTYTVTLAASGSAQADNPGDEFTDVLPAGLNLVSATASSGTAIANVGTRTVTWNGAIAAGGSVTITIAATIDAGASGTLSNQGRFAYDADGDGSNEASGVTDDPSTLAPNDPTAFAVGVSADLSITNSDGVATATAGTTSTYAIVVANAGPSAVTGAHVADAFPAECSAPTWTCAASGGGSCPAGGSGAIAASVDLPSGASATFTASCPIGASVAAGTVVTNTATVAVPAGASDPNPANDSATDTTVVTAAPGAALGGTKTVSGDFSAGGAVTYTIVLGNTGAGAQADNPGDEFTDALPAGLHLVSASTSGGTAVANLATNSVTWNGAIAAGGNVTITIAASIDADASGTIANQGRFAYDSDANGSNDASGVTDDPGLGGSADPTAFVVAAAPAEATPVPSLTPLGFALLAIGLALAGLRRRRGMSA